MSTASLHTSWQRHHWRIAAVTTAWSRLDHSTRSRCFSQVSKKKIFNYSPACLVHCDGACQKLRNQMQNYLWNIRTKRVAPFSGQCNLPFLSTKVLQGSVATWVNYGTGMIFIDYVTENLLQSLIVKEFWKSFSIYRPIKWQFFSTDTVYSLIRDQPGPVLGDVLLRASQLSLAIFL